MRVRIAVAIDDKGNYCCAGFTDEGRPAADNELVTYARDGLDTQSMMTAVHFIEADVPLPVPLTIKGTTAKS